MAKYSIKSKSTGHSVEVEYDEGVLCGVFYSMSKEQSRIEPIQWMQQNLPVRESAVMGFHTDRFRIEEVVENVSFDAFWDAYGRKVSRPETERKWQKLTMAERGTAIRSIKKYRAFCAQQNPPRLIMDPATYLNRKSFNDEWNII